MALATWLLERRLNLPLMLNGALAGLVSTTAEPVAPSVAGAMAIGAAGALIMMGATRLLERFRLDDAVGAIPVHLAAGAWGAIAVAFSNPDASLTVQAVGVVAVGAFVGAASWIFWMAIDAAMGARLSDEQEQNGGDIAEFGMQAHNFS
jgi:Amt family ammonium transporter